jgi:hypothetical protein
MNIILGQENAETLSDRYVVLELDSFRIKPDYKVVKAYCLIENLGLIELMQVDQYKNLHSKLIENYQKRNWNFCLQAIDNLRGQWTGQLDSFYEDLCFRIQSLQNTRIDDDWDYVIDR